MNSNIQRYTLRVEASLLEKIRYIAKYEGRSANKETEQIIKRRILSLKKKMG